MALPVPGPRAVRAALEGGLRVRRVMLAADAPAAMLRDVRRLAERAGTRLEPSSRDELDRLAGGTGHQGIVALVELPDPIDPMALVDGWPQDKEPPLLLALDGIQDPQNLGAVFRAAEGAGVDAVILPERGAAHVSPGAVRASAGAAVLVPHAIVPDLADCLRELSRSGVSIVGAVADAGPTLHDAALTGPLVLVLGGESEGIRTSVAARCDRTVRIPMRGTVASLNVAAAAAVLLFEARRQRERRHRPDEAPVQRRGVAARRRDRQDGPPSPKGT